MSDGEDILQHQRTTELRKECFADSLGHCQRLIERRRLATNVQYSRTPEVQGGLEFKLGTSNVEDLEPQSFKFKLRFSNAVLALKGQGQMDSGEPLEVSLEDLQYREFGHLFNAIAFSGTLYDIYIYIWPHGPECSQ